MVNIQSLAAKGVDTTLVLADLASQIESNAKDASFVFVFYGCDHNDAAILDFVRQRFPKAKLAGGTSCGGVGSNAGMWGTRGIGLLVIHDPEGYYGAGCGVLGDAPADAAEKILIEALADSGCPGEVPELIWIYQTPGREEEVIEGLRRVVGDRCPIVGGSSADDTVAGH
ncbi:FIST N-terminal domain-containing protein [Xanthobacteraceae bacterium Astr-EGSB]|uniref:FIST N-terminal domain-containing protein n=1 Tax=Astrobacterium formosum TaxID=3069710 RepID=UPI0027B28FDB|nr:FIST N-terminal domain-containing protein [Xanthobacteraceae bacterium Astr-EGSB]